MPNHRIETGGSTVGNLQLNNTGTALITNPLVSTVSGSYGRKTGNGWAVQAGVKFNLPMIAAGDYVYLQAAYSKGNLSYANSGNPSSWQGSAYGIDRTTFVSYDAVVGPAGRITLTPAWSALISYEHYWTPTIRQGVFGGVYHVEYSSAIRSAAGFSLGAACPTCVGTVATATGALFNPFSPYYDGGYQYNVGSNVIWSPVKDLDIGVEVMYLRNDMQHKQFDIQNRGRGVSARTTFG